MGTRDTWEPQTEGFREGSPFSLGLDGGVVGVGSTGVGALEL